MYIAFQKRELHRRIFEIIPIRIIALQSIYSFKQTKLESGKRKTKASFHRIGVTLLLLLEKKICIRETLPFFKEQKRGTRAILRCYIEQKR